RLEFKRGGPAGLRDGGRHLGAFAGPLGKRLQPGLGNLDDLRLSLLIFLQQRLTLLKFLEVLLLLALRLILDRGKGSVDTGDQLIDAAHGALRVVATWTEMARLSIIQFPKA